MLLKGWRNAKRQSGWAGNPQVENVAILSFRSGHHPSSGFGHLLLEKSLHLFLWPQTHGTKMMLSKKASKKVRTCPARHCFNTESCFSLCSGLQYQDIFTSYSNRNDGNTNFPEKAAIFNFFFNFISLFHSKFLSPENIFLIWKNIFFNSYSYLYLFPSKTDVSKLYFQQLKDSLTDLLLHLSASCC